MNITQLVKEAARKIQRTYPQISVFDADNGVVPIIQATIEKALDESWSNALDQLVAVKRASRSQAVEAARAWCREVETEGPPLQPDEFALLVKHFQVTIEKGIQEWLLQRGWKGCTFEPSRGEKSVEVSDSKLASALALLLVLFHDDRLPEDVHPVIWKEIEKIGDQSSYLINELRQLRAMKESDG